MPLKNDFTNCLNKEFILNMLMDRLGTAVPGRKLSQSLGISRAGVWKHMASLRDQGFKISSGGKSGYVLESVPDLLLPVLVQRDLKTIFVGKKIEYFKNIDSTNTAAKSLASRGAPDGTLVIAEHQTKGRGRMSRSWIAPSGKNILMSVIFYPEVSAPLVFRLTMLASIAVVRALKKVCHLKATIKWPNDVYVDGKKVCGVLTEFSADHDRVHYTVVGIGLNVNFNTSKNSEIKEISTSLMEKCGKKVSRLDLLNALLEELDLLYKIFKEKKGEGLEKEWNANSMVINQKVKILSGKEERQGVAKGITPMGHLVLLNEQGETEEIVCGDLSLRLS